MKRVFLLILLTCCLLIAPAAAAGGSGTASSPYIIQTAAELQSIQNNLAAYYELGNDIDLSGVTWTPIGSSSAPFVGSLDGNGYSISNLYINSGDSYSGLFSYVSGSAIITDLTLNNCNIEDASAESGLLIAVIISPSEITISNIILSHNEVTYVSNYNGGLFIGNIINDGTATITITDITLKYCEMNNNKLSVRGLLLGSIRDSSTSTTITISDIFISSSKIKDSSSSSSMGICIGSIYSSNNLIITNININDCILTINYNQCGGIISYCTSNSNVKVSNCNVINCVLSGNNYVGGIIGRNEGKLIIDNCNVINCVLSGNNYAGGIIGISNTDSPISDCIISGCTILANTYAAGVCPAYS